MIPDSQGGSQIPKNYFTAGQSPMMKHKSGYEISFITGINTYQQEIDRNRLQSKAIAT